MAILLLLFRALVYQNSTIELCPKPLVLDIFISHVNITVTYMSEYVEKKNIDIPDHP